MNDPLPADPAELAAWRLEGLVDDAQWQAARARLGPLLDQALEEHQRIASAVQGLPRPTATMAPVILARLPARPVARRHDGAWWIPLAIACAACVATAIVLVRPPASEVTSAPAAGTPVAIGGPQDRRRLPRHEDDAPVGQKSLKDEVALPPAPALQGRRIVPQPGPRYGGASNGPQDTAPSAASGGPMPAAQAPAVRAPATPPPAAPAPQAAPSVLYIAPHAGAPGGGDGGSAAAAATDRGASELPVAPAAPDAAFRARPMEPRSEAPAASDQERGTAREPTAQAPVPRAEEPLRRLDIAPLAGAANAAGVPGNDEEDAKARGIDPPVVIGLRCTTPRTAPQGMVLELSIVNHRPEALTIPAEALILTGAPDERPAWSTATGLPAATVVLAPGARWQTPLTLTDAQLPPPQIRHLALRLGPLRSAAVAIPPPAGSPSIRQASPAAPPAAPPPAPATPVAPAGP